MLVVWTQSPKTEARTRKGVTLSPLLLRCSNDDGRDAVFKCSHLKGQIKFACLKAELEPQTGPLPVLLLSAPSSQKETRKKVHGLSGNTPFPNPLKPVHGVAKNKHPRKNILVLKKIFQRLWERSVSLTGQTDTTTKQQAKAGSRQ